MSKVIRRTNFGHQLLLEVVGRDRGMYVTKVIGVREHDNGVWHSTESEWFETRFGTRQSLVLQYFEYELDIME